MGYVLHAALSDAQWRMLILCTLWKPLVNLLRIRETRSIKCAPWISLNSCGKLPNLFRKKNVFYTCEKKKIYKGASKGFTSEAQMMPKNVSTCRKKRNRVFSELLSLKFIRVVEIKELEKIKMKLSTFASSWRQDLITGNVSNKVYGPIWRPHSERLIWISKVVLEINFKEL